MKIKVKRVRGGSMGDQRDYGLVAGSIWNYEDKPTTNQVSDTVGPVDRDEATIEAERGETVVGDINNDGMLEHFIVGGKRHFQGGTPLNVPDGSFVFSDTRALNIKNKDVLKNIFGVTASKGMTPAKVAKKFDLNQYNDLLLDPEADAMSKRTAQMMLDNNLRKLGQLALVQEGMKGFPDGIPDIALPLFASDIASSQPSPQMMRRGGLVKYQNAGQKKEMTAAENAAMTKRVQAKAMQAAIKKWRNASVGSAASLEALQTMRNIGYIPEEVVDHYRTYPTLGQQEGVDVSRRYTDIPKGTTPYDRSQRAAVFKASQYYNKGILSQNPETMREAARKIEGVGDVPGLTTGALGTANFLINYLAAPATTLFSDLTGIGAREEGYIPQLQYAPEGFTWQERVTNMKDMLEREADEIENREGAKKLKSKAVKTTQDYTSKYNTVLSRINDILGNPHVHTPEEIATANQWNEIINDPRFLGIPSRFTWEENPYERRTKTNPPAKMAVKTGLFRKAIVEDDINQAYKDLTKTTTAKTDKKTEQLAPTQQAMSPTDTSAAPNVSSSVRAADTSGQNITVDPTASTREQAVRTAPKSKPAVQTPSQPSDIEIIEFLKEVKEGEDPTPDEVTSYKRTMGYKRMGGDLPMHQSTGPVKKTSYNLTDKKFREAAKQKGLAINPSAWSWYDPNLPAIGPQTVLSSSGIFGRADSPKPIITELKNYPGVKDWTEYAPGGFDQWVADMAAAKGNPSKASEFWAKKRKEYEIGKTGMSSIDENVKGWNVPGVELMTPYVFGQAMPTPTAGSEPYPFTEQPAVAAAKSGPGAVPTPVYSPTSYYQPWSNYSNIDVMGAMMNYMDVNRGDLPTLYTYTPTLPDPTFLDPARAIAQQQGLVAQSTEDIASRSFDPTTARANIIAAQAQSAEPIANIQAKYDEANTQIANQFAQQNAAALNDAQLKNIAFRDKYQGELQTLQQQYDNALREGRTEVAEAIKRAMVDQMQRGALNVQNPNYAIGPNGQIYFKPGYNVLTGENMYASAGSGQFNKLLDMYSKPPYNYTPENAIKAASAAAKLNEDKIGKYGMSVSNPMDIIWG